MQGLKTIIAHRLIPAFLRLPSTEAWLYSAVLLFVYTLISLPIGIKLGFLKVEILSSWKTAVRVLLVAFIAPSLVEEIFFRVLLLPNSTEVVSPAVRWFFVCLSLVIFVGYHPLNVLAGCGTFRNPVFLFLAALLGIICTSAYLQSGSLWPPVILHWLIVVVWLLVLGGYRKVHGNKLKDEA
jgi:predicted Abi (CAAX) family protease